MTVGIKGDAVSATSQSNGGTAGVYVTTNRGGILRFDAQKVQQAYFRDTSYAVTSIVKIGDKIVVFVGKWHLATDNLQSLVF